MGEAPAYADELAVARLNVLERRGRWQEYLYLAELLARHGRKYKLVPMLQALR